MKSAICVVVKNEERHIQEWILFHSILGFDTVFVIDNGSEDKTWAAAESLLPLVDVRLMSIPGRGGNIQARLYGQLCRENAAEFDWIAFIDADEFLVPQHDTHIRSLLKRFQTADAILLPWTIFGSNGHRKPPPGLVIEDYQARSEASFHANRHVKSIVRPGRVLRALNPHCFETDGEQRLADGGLPAWDHPGLLRNRPAVLDWSVHHYFTRSRAHWTDRLRRGQLGDSPRNWHFFDEYDRNEVKDSAAVRFADAVKLKLARVQAANWGLPAHLAARMHPSAGVRQAMGGD